MCLYIYSSAGLCWALTSSCSQEPQFLLWAKMPWISLISEPPHKGKGRLERLEIMARGNVPWLQDVEVGLEPSL